MDYKLWTFLWIYLNLFLLFLLFDFDFMVLWLVLDFLITYLLFQKKSVKHFSLLHHVYLFQASLFVLSNLLYIQLNLKLIFAVLLQFLNLLKPTAYSFQEMFNEVGRYKKMRMKRKTHSFLKRVILQTMLIYWK